MAGQYGVKETKELFDMGFELVKAGKLVFADGKVTFGDVAYVIPIFPRLESGVMGSKDSVKELLELDEADSADLLSYARARLPEFIQDDVLRQKIAVYVKLALSFSEALSVSL